MIRRGEREGRERGEGGERKGRGKRKRGEREGRGKGGWLRSLECTVKVHSAQPQPSETSIQWAPLET